MAGSTMTGLTPRPRYTGTCSEETERQVSLWVTGRQRDRSPAGRQRDRPPDHHCTAVLRRLRRIPTSQTQENTKKGLESTFAFMAEVYLWKKRVNICQSRAERLPPCLSHDTTPPRGRGSGTWNVTQITSAELFQTKIITKNKGGGFRSPHLARLPAPGSWDGPWDGPWEGPRGGMDGWSGAMKH